MNQKKISNPSHVSVHGGHSGEFCDHARDSLEKIITAYIRQGFAWAGITEHMPPVSDAFMYPDEKAAGWSAGRLYDWFAGYMAKARELQAKYAGKLDIYVGFETEFTTGSLDFIRHLIDRFKPDYCVGSLHHVDDISFEINQGETLGLVGESGCGKTTAGRAMLRLLDATEGAVFFRDQDIFGLDRHQLLQMRKKMQIIFQDPYGSLNPRITVGGGAKGDPEGP